MRIAVLGSTGMLGSMVKMYFEDKGYEVVFPTLDEFDASIIQADDIIQVLGEVDYVINCIGLIKQKIDEYDTASVEDAIKINSLFPRELAKTGYNIIQIETDCVFDGIKGNYDENSPHNPTDIYGKTKSLGEVAAKNVMHIRTSIIGPNGPKSFFDWVVNQPENSVIDGYKNHLWNGITTLDFARICQSIIDRGITGNKMESTIHVQPLDYVSKYDLARLVAKWFRPDIKVKKVNARQRIDRRLRTITGIIFPLRIEQMIAELRDYLEKRSK